MDNYIDFNNTYLKYQMKEKFLFNWKKKNPLKIIIIKKSV